MSKSNRTYKVKKQPEFLGGGWNLQLLEDGAIQNVYNYESKDGPLTKFNNIQSTDLGFITCHAEGFSFVEFGWLPVCAGWIR